MAKDIDLDDFNLDDMDFGVPEWGDDGSDTGGNNRSPISNMVKGAITAAGDEILSVGSLKRAMTMALPEGYGLAADTLSNVATDARSLYDKIAGESPEIVSNSKKFAQRVANSSIGKKLLPKSISDRLNSALEEPDSYQSDAGESTDPELASLAEMFKAKAAADEHRNQQSEVRETEKKALEQIRFKSSIQALTAISKGISRIVGYQDSITSRYQQKALELSYRQLATQKKMLDLYSVNSAQMLKTLDTIRHNTALPEMVKYHKSELVAHLAKERLFGAGLSSISNFTSNYGKQVSENVGSLLNGVLDPLRTVQSGMDMSGMSPGQMAAAGVGAAIGESVRDYGAMHLSPVLERIPGVVRGGEKLKRAFTGLPQQLNEYAQSDTQGTGWKAQGLRLLKSFLPQYSMDSRAGVARVDELDVIDKFDRIARRSLIEIIPGYLAEIAHWTRASATGDLTSEKQVYNVVRGGFTGQSQQLKDAGRQIISRQEKESVRQEIEDFMESIGGDMLSPPARYALKRKLLSEMANVRDLKPDRLADPESFPGVDADVVDEITAHIRDTFNLDFDGKQTDTSDEGLKRFNSIRDRYLRAAQTIPNVGERIRVYSDTLGYDVMRKLGFVVTDKDSREDRINFNQAWEELLDDNGDDKSPRDPAPRSEVVSDRPGLLDDIRRRLRTDDPTDTTVPGGVADDIGAGVPSRKGLERYLGEKSLIISILKESRGYHAETVELLRAIQGVGQVGGGRGTGLGEMANRSKAWASDSFSTISRWATGAYSTASDKLGEFKSELYDIWVQGDDHPRLQAAKLKSKEYIDSATNTVIEHWGQITSDVQDKRGKIVARFEEIMSNGQFTDKKGQIVASVRGKMAYLVGEAKKLTQTKYGARAMDGINSLGNRINSYIASDSIAEAADKLGGDLIDAGSKGVGSAKDILKATRPRFNKLMKFFTRDKTGADITSELTGDPQRDQITLLLRSVQLQYETLNAVKPKEIRKGSFTDILSRRQEMKDKISEKIENAKNGLSGLFSKKGLLAGLLGGAAAAGGTGEEGGGGDINVDYWGGDSVDGKDGKKKPGGKAPNGGKPRGKIGKAWDFAKRWGNKGLDKLGTAGNIIRGAWGVGKWGVSKAWGLGKWGVTKAWGLGRGLLMNPVTRTVLATAGRMALGAVLGAAGMISAPVLAIGGVVLGAVAIGTLIYGATRDKLPPLSRLRMAQYGLDPKPDSEYIPKIIELERLFAKHTTIQQDGSAKIDVNSVPVESIMKILDIAIKENMDPREDEHFMRAMQFLNSRFSTVFLAHISNYHALTQSMELAQVDKALSGKSALEFAKQVRLAEHEAILDQMVAPFKDEDELDQDAGDAEDVYDDVISELEKAIAKETPPKSAAAQHAAALSATAATGAAIVNNTSDRAVGAPPASSEKGGGGGGGSTGSVAVPSSKLVTASAVGVVSSGAIATLSAAPSTPASLTNGVDTGWSIRFHTYGLTEMDESKCMQLLRLESALWSGVTYDRDGVASIDLNEGRLVAENIFSPIGKEVEDVYIWFHRRFAPAFLSYCTAVRRNANIDAKDASQRLKPGQLVDVLRSMVNARDNAGISVWDIDASPWAGYLLAADSSIVKDAMTVLESQVKSNTLHEKNAPTGAMVRNAKGELVSPDPTQTNRPKVDASGRVVAERSSGDGRGLLESIGNSFKKASNWVGSLFGGKEEQSGTQQQASGNASLPPGTAISHPGGGTGGNVNDIPVPSGAGWNASKATLMAAANMVGVDPALAAAIAGVESSYDPNARPWSKRLGKYLSSAGSYYQVINDTWKELMGKYAAKYGIHPDTTQHDPRANALLGLEYIRENIDRIKGSVGSRGVRDTDVYLAHFLGPYGAQRFLSADPSQPAINHVGADQAEANPSIFYDSSGRPRTVAQVYADFDNKLKKHRKDDAATIAMSLKKGLGDEFVGPLPEGAEPSETAQVTNQDPLQDPSVTTPMTSLAKPADVPVTNTVIEPTPTSADYTADADQRQVQSSTASLRMAAVVAEKQSMTATQNTAKMSSSLDGTMSSLLSVNEAQLARLVELVEVIRASGSVQTAATPSSKTTSSESPVAQSRAMPAKPPTVSVSR